MKLTSSLLKLSLLSVFLLPRVLLAQGFEIPTGTSPSELVNLDLIRITDPAGHSCCVTAPPSLLQVFLIEGKLGIESTDNSTVPWLPFDSMVIDANSDFTGQNSATIAGFNNIVSVITGRITAESITATVTVGANGGLPTGAPIVFEIELAPASSPTFFTPVTISPTFSVNVANGPGISIAEFDAALGLPSSFSISIDSNGFTGGVDYWLVTIENGAISSFDLTTGKFEPGLRPTFQEALADLEIPVEIEITETFEIEPLSLGEITIGFGIDDVQDGVVTEDRLFFDAANYKFD